MTAINYKSDFIQTISERGFIHQCTDLSALDEACATGSITAYIGYDATAPSLHAGHLVQIMLLYWLQKTGHRPIVLMGGGTTKVGDPTFKDTQRPFLSDETIEENINNIKSIFNSFIRFNDVENNGLILNNDVWLSKFGYVEFLRNFGTQFTINRMLSFDSVKLRLEREQPMSFLEFNYMLMQAVDFYELNKNYDCILQMGGSDQWGNIINGVELNRKMAQKTVFGLTSPLLTTASGAKMGKTVGGAVWLNANQLSPYDYWQYWRNTEDADVGKFLRLFTDISLDEIGKLEALKDAEINEAKKILADSATRLVHGLDAAQKARETAQSAFEKGVFSGEIPRFEINAEQLFNGLPLANLVTMVGFTSSNSEARRLCAGGGIKVNDISISDGNTSIDKSFINSDGNIRISVGKKKIILIDPID